MNISPKKSNNDDRTYSYLTLQNEMKVLLISDPKTDKSSASLDVNIGSLDNPKDRQGLAHFLEQYIFFFRKNYILFYKY